MALEHLRESITKGNLWLYILKALEDRPSTPVEAKAAVKRAHSFAPATITFYSVLYKLRREGLVRKSSDSFRSSYEITDKGKTELVRAKALLSALSLELEG